MISGKPPPALKGTGPQSEVLDFLGQPSNYGDGDQGEFSQWEVKMCQFRQEALFDHMARQRGLSFSLCRDLAQKLATFHQSGFRVCPKTAPWHWCCLGPLYGVTTSNDSIVRKSLILIITLARPIPSRLTLAGVRKRLDDHQRGDLGPCAASLACI